RRQFVRGDSLEPNNLRMDIEQLREVLSGRLGKYLDTTRQRELLGILPEAEREEIEYSVARGSATDVPMEYIDMRMAARIFALEPQLFFEASCFTVDWTPTGLVSRPKAVEQHQEQVARSIGSMLAEIGDFASVT